MVFGTAVRLLGSPAEAEDVAQTVFLRAFQRFDTIGSSPAAAGWLKTVTRNACLNHLSRHRSRWRLFSELERPGADPADAAESPGIPGMIDERRLVAEGSPAVEMEARERRARLEQALSQLPDHQRVPIVLFHFEEASYQEIADTLGVSLAKVKIDIHRGREALRTLLADYAPR